jgi:putative oxidoreductase
MDLALFVLRLVVGLLFVGHGAQKLFGIFGGSGLEGTAGFFEQTGLRPGRTHATAAGIAELGGGLLLALGFLTTIGAAALIAVMTAAVIVVHGRKGIWNTEGGFEYNAVLAAVAFALATIGAGSWSVDSAVGIDLSGIGWGLAALGAGLLGGIGAVLTGRLEERHRTHDHHTPPHPA